MKPLLKELRHNPMLWLLALVPVVLIGAKLAPAAHTLLFVLAVLAIVPLAALLSHATESVAEKTGDAVGGLLNATLGNLTELVIAIAALHAGQYTLVKGSIAGAIVTNTLFMLGASFLLGGLEHRIQEYNRASARLHAGLLLLATIALVSPSAIARTDLAAGAAVTQKLSVGLAVLLIVGYGLGLLFSLETHREIFAGAEHAEGGEPAWPIGLALGTLGVVTILVALVSEIFVESVQEAAEAFGMSPAFVGFVVVALVGGAAEMTVALSAARKDRLDLSVGIALGSASQIALFVGPVLVLLSYVIGPAPMDLQFWPGAVVMVFVATLVAAFITSGGRSAWFIGALLILVYAVFAMTLYLLPPGVQQAAEAFDSAWKPALVARRPAVEEIQMVRFDDELRKTIRRNKLLGMWAAEKLGLAGADAEAYSDALAMDTIDPERSDVFSRICQDFDAAGVVQSREQILGVMNELIGKAADPTRTTRGDSTDGAAVTIARNLTSR